MAEAESLVPVAAIVDLILGIVTIILVKRSGEREWIEKIGGLLIGWLLIIKGCEYTFASILEFLAENPVWIGDADLGNSFFRFGRATCRTLGYILMGVLPLYYPYPIIQKDWGIKALSGFVSILGILITTLWILTDFVYKDTELFLLVPGFFLLLAVYARFIVMESRDPEISNRRMSMVAGLLMIALYGEQMTYWFAQAISLNDEFVARFTVEFSLWNPAPISWLGVNTILTIGVGSILALLAGESWRAYHFGINGFTLVVFLITITGFIAGVADYVVLDIVNSCVETTCEEWPRAFDIWYDFTSETLVYLFTPLIMMFILLNFDIIDSESKENTWMTRIMVILMLLIVSSSVIELLQSFLPVPQMISSAALAMVVAIFIGWEERIMESLIREGDSVSNKLLELDELARPGFDESEYAVFTYAMSAMLFFCLLINLLYWAVI